MPTINQLNQVTQLYTSDQIPVYSNANGDARKASLNQLLDLFQQQFASPTETVQLVVPATGFNYAVTGTSVNAWVLLQPAGTLATGTVTLPVAASTADGMEVLVTTTQIITTFTLGANGAAATYGAPTTMAANAFFRMRFYQATNSWYRVG